MSNWIKSEEQTPADGEAIWITQRRGGKVAKANCNRKFVPVEIWIVGAPYFWQRRLNDVKPEPPKL